MLCRSNTKISSALGLGWLFFERESCNWNELDNEKRKRLYWNGLGLIILKPIWITWTIRLINGFRTHVGNVILWTLKSNLWFYSISLWMKGWCIDMLLVMTKTSCSKKCLKEFKVRSQLIIFFHPDKEKFLDSPLVSNVLVKLARRPCQWITRVLKCE